MEMALEKRVFHPKLWSWWISYVWDGAMLVCSCGGGCHLAQRHIIMYLMQSVCSKQVSSAGKVRSGDEGGNQLFNLGNLNSTCSYLKCEQGVTFVWKMSWWLCLSGGTQCWLSAVSKICKSSTICKSQRYLQEGRVYKMGIMIQSSV